MYSKNKNMSQNSYPDLTPPPGYDGSRLFTRRERSDGRDENYVVHTRPIYRGRDKGREKDTGMSSNRKSGTSGRQTESEAPIEMIYEDEPETSLEHPSFPGIETFLEEENYWEDTQPDADSQYEEEPEETPKKHSHEEHKNKPNGSILPEPLAGLLHGLDREDLLLIGLIILLSGEKDMSTSDILLLLALLLLTK